MNLDDLARLLTEMHNNAQKGDKSYMTHLFGILFAQEICNAKTKSPEIINYANKNFNANLSKNYSTEINKGKKLSEYLHIDNNKRGEILRRLNIVL
jgi:hypothetical protein